MLKKLVIGLAVVAMVFGVSASFASAAITQADVAALCAVLSCTPAQMTLLSGVASTPSAPSMGAMAFTQNLTVGSKGEEVTALQNVLISGGYLAAGLNTGYFGNATKAAVMKWQAAAGVSPASGYFGPLSRAALNGSMVATTPTCPAGMTCTPTTPAPTMPCPAGYSCTPSTGTMSMDGTDGSVTVSYNPFAPASQTIKKGEAKNVIAVKLQATGGPVTVSRFDVNTSERPWLLFSKVELLDMSGNVLATKNLSGPSDATEVQVGSNYQIRFEGVNYQVKPGSDAILVLRFSVLAASDKITGQTIYVGVPSGSIRTINGKGYTDSVGLTSGSGSGVTSSTGNAVTLTSTGSAGDIYSSISPSSPGSARYVTTSASTVTPNVILGVYRLKSQNVSSTLNNLNFTIQNSTGAATSSIFSNVRLEAGGAIYGASSLDGSTMFTNMTVPLPLDQWVDLTLKADIAANTTAVNASSTLVKASISGVDANFNSLTITNASNATSQDTNFLISGLAVSNILVTPPSKTFDTSGIWRSASANFTFTLTNTSNADVYYAKSPNTAMATTSSTGATASSTLGTAPTTVTPDSYAGDTSTYYVIPAGASRTFTYNGFFSNAVTDAGARLFRITTIYFDDDTTGLQEFNVNFGLSNLNVNIP